MGCKLSPEEIFVLTVLVKNRCLRADEAYNSKKLKKLYSKKFRNHGMKFDKCIKMLLNRGFIVQVKKKDIKYYVPNSAHSDVLIALGKCGVDIPKGGVHKM